MDILGVVDLMDGRAVHARQGRRDQYAPVARVAQHSTPGGDPSLVARAYLDAFGLDALYVADLDAILGRPPQDRLVSSLVSLGAAVWLDQGVATADRARHARHLGASHVIVGLETLPSWATLDGICGALPRARVALSLDLRDGVPLVRFPPGGYHDSLAIAARAADAGIGSLIVLDLSRVGAGGGLDFDLIGSVRRAVPHVRVYAGGGVRHAEDLRRLQDLGCDGALVATALHEGRIGPDDLRSFRTTHQP